MVLVGEGDWDGDEIEGGLGMGDWNGVRGIGMGLGGLEWG